MMIMARMNMKKDVRFTPCINFIAPVLGSLGSLFLM